MRRAAPANWSNLPNRTVAFLHGLGPKPTSPGRGGVSASRGKADMTRTGCHFRVLMLWTAPTLRHRSAIGWLR